DVERVYQRRILAVRQFQQPGSLQSEHIIRNGRQPAAEYRRPVSNDQNAPVGRGQFLQVFERKAVVGPARVPRGDLWRAAKGGETNTPQERRQSTASVRRLAEQKTPIGIAQRLASGRTMRG